MREESNNKSLKYIYKRIENGNCCNMPIEEFNNMSIIPFNSCYENYTILAIKENSNNIFADLTYSPNAEFNYFITEYCICDGTFIFMTELMSRILKKIKQLETCYAPALEGIFREELDNGNYTIHYEVGDFIVNSCLIEPPYKDKPWMSDRFTVMLPVKFTIEKI